MAAPDTRAAAFGKTLNVDDLTHDVDNDHILIVRNLLHHLPQDQSTSEMESAIADTQIREKLISGGVFLKYGKRGDPHFRVVWCSDDLRRVNWGEPKGNTRQVKHSFNVEDIDEVRAGHTTEIFKRNVQKRGAADQCFSIVGADRTLDLECVSAQEKDLWLLAFNYLLGKKGGPRGSMRDLRPKRAGEQLPSVHTLLDQVAMLKAKLADSVPKEEVEKLKDALTQDVPTQVDEAHIKLVQNQKVRLEEEQAKVRRLSIKVDQLSAQKDDLSRQRERLMSMTDESQKFTFLQEQLTQQQQQIDELQRELNLETDRNQGLEDREARRQAMLWALDDQFSEQVHLDPYGDAQHADNVSTQQTAASTPWMPAQSRRLQREKNVARHYFPQAEWHDEDTQACQVHLEVAGPKTGTQYKLALVLANYPVTPIRVIILEPEHLTDGQGRSLVEIGHDSNLHTLAPLFGSPQIDYPSRSKDPALETPTVLHVLRESQSWVEDFDSTR